MARVGPHFQIFLHRHVQKDASAFGHLGKPEFNHFVGRHFRQLPAEKRDAARARQQAGDGVQRRGLAGAVGADQRDGLALKDFEGNALDGVVPP